MPGLNYTMWFKSYELLTDSHSDYSAHLRFDWLKEECQLCRRNAFETFSLAKRRFAFSTHFNPTRAQRIENVHVTRIASGCDYNCDWLP